MLKTSLCPHWVTWSWVCGGQQDVGEVRTGISPQISKGTQSALLLPGGPTFSLSLASPSPET